RRVECVLKYVRKFSYDFREARKSIACRSAAQGVGRDIQTFEVLMFRLDVLQHTDVFPEILQMLRGFLEEDFDGFAVRRAHARPSVASSSGFSNSSAVGSRYNMQSFNTMA